MQGRWNEYQKITGRVIDFIFVKLVRLFSLKKSGAIQNDGTGMLLSTTESVCCFFLKVTQLKACGSPNGTIPHTYIYIQIYCHATNDPCKKIFKHTHVHKHMHARTHTHTHCMRACTNTCIYTHLPKKGRKGKKHVLSQPWLDYCGPHILSCCQQKRASLQRMYGRLVLKPTVAGRWWCQLTFPECVGTELVVAFNIQINCI